MPDIRRAPVEEFKITEEQKAWTGKFKQLAQVREIIEDEGFTKMAELKNLQELYRSLMESVQGHMEQTPTKPVDELPGMRFENEGGEGDGDAQNVRFSNAPRLV